MRYTKIEWMQRKLLSSIEIIQSPNEKNIELLMIPTRTMESKYVKTRELQFFRLIGEKLGPILTHSSGQFASKAPDRDALMMMRLKRSTHNLLCA